MPHDPPRALRYHRIATLGEGGMGRVFLAVTRGKLGVDKLLVLKELKPELARDPEFLTMFIEEARLAARLSHPNVIHTYDVEVEGDSCVIAMEYLEGQALNAVIHRMKRERMPLSAHVGIIARALAGLHYAHELVDFDGTPLAVVHRDVSPQNLFVTYDGQVKLLDFGIAKAVGSAAVTRAGVFKGKLSYAAPEQALSKPVDRRADVFAMGVMLWEALTRKRLVPAGSGLDVTIFQRRTEGTEPRVLEANPDASPELAAVCDRAMAVNPEDRFATAAEFAAALEQASSRAGIEASAAEIGALVRDAFAEERAKMRALVEEHIRKLRRETIGSSPTIRLPAGGEGADNTPSSGMDGATLANAVATRGEGSDPQTSSRSAPMRAASRKVLAALAMVALGALGALFLLRGRHEPLKASATTEAASAPNVTDAPSATSATSAVAPRVQIAIRALPTQATLSLDGALLTENPFHAAVPRDAVMHRVRAAASGFLPEERIVVFDADASLEITLQRAPKDQRAVSPAAASPAPGASTSPKRRPVIDEKDPYLQ